MKSIRIIRLLFSLIILLAFVHSMAIYDYNLPLFIALFFLWEKFQPQRYTVIIVIIFTLVSDALFLLWHTKTFSLKKSFSMYEMESWTQTKTFMTYFRVSFSVNLFLKSFIILWVLFTKAEIREKFSFEHITDSLLKFVMLG